MCNDESWLNFSGNDFTISAYLYIKLLCYIPKANTMLYVSYISLKKRNTQISRCKAHSAQKNSSALGLH